MRCPDCGVEVTPDFKFCPRCGYSFLGGTSMSQRYAPPQKKGIGPLAIVLIIVLAVAITIVPSVVLYWFVAGFGPDDQVRTPAATYSKSTVQDGVKITIVSITKTDVSWDDIRVQLTDGTVFGQWDTFASDLDTGAAVSADYGTQYLGVLAVDLTVTDLGGNGVVSGTDYFTLKTSSGFSSTTTYSAGLIYQPTGELIGTGITFIG